MDDQISSRLDTIEALLIQRIKEHREEEEKVARWHLKKEVTIAHILSSVGLIAITMASYFSLTAAVAALDTRTLNITEARITTVESHVDVVDEYMRENFGDISTTLSTINGKLDVLEERTVENRRQN